MNEFATDNPYRSPLAESGERLETPPEHEPLIPRLRQQRLTLAVSWLLIGSLVAFFAAIIPVESLAAILIKGFFVFLGVGWVASGVGSIFAARPWVTAGLVLNYVAVFMLLCLGLGFLIGSSERDKDSRYVAAVIMQLPSLLPLMMLRQAHRVLRWTRLLTRTASL